MIIDSRYEVIKEMGGGPWSRLFKVLDIREQKTYALKLFDGISSNEFYEHFSPERMHHVKNITHDNLIKIHDFGNFNQHIYYISDFYAGRTLADFNFLPDKLELLYDIVVKLSYALSALHSQNLVHQQLKPSNIGFEIVNASLEVKIMDYGLSKVDLRNENIMSNYLPYIAPELYQNSQPTPQSDFYSLGVILYQITTGSLPFSLTIMRQFQESRNLSLIPQFPRKLNKQIPVNLENMILQLLDMNPKERYGSAEEIISYINSIQPKKYAFSQKLSLVHQIQLSEYIVRQDYAHNLLDYLDSVLKGNGKLITLHAGKGMGKTHALVLFRYHLLTGEYFIFDYNCSPQNKDPFFALMKEFYKSVESNRQFQKEMCDVSDQMSRYIFDNPNLLETDRETDLQKDFELASNFLKVLSAERPLIFTIRSCQYITNDVIEFLNFFSTNYLTNLRIMIILSVNDARRLKDLQHPVTIRLEPLSLEETRDYVKKLLKTEIPESFLEMLRRRTWGNPQFIEKVLIDMTSHRLIWDSGNFTFERNWKDYRLPNELIDDIFQKMSHLAAGTYLQMLPLATIEVPLTTELIRTVLQLSDKELYQVLSDGENNEILYKERDQIFFTYREARQRFQRECEETCHKRISEMVLLYFSDQEVGESESEDEWNQIRSRNLMEYLRNENINSEATLKGLLDHAGDCNNTVRYRLYLKFLAKYYESRKEFVKGFEEMVSVLKYDLKSLSSLQKQEFREDMFLLVSYANWLELNQMPKDFARVVRRMSDSFEKHFLTAAFELEMERNENAQKALKQALPLAENEFERMRVLLLQGKYYVRMGQYADLHNVLTELATMELYEEFETTYTDLKSFELSHEGKITEAIKFIKEYLHKNISCTKPAYFIEQGSIYVNLGQLYYAEGDNINEKESYLTALSTWNTIHYKRKLGIVYNNLGDIALRQGNLVEAFDYLQKAKEISKQVNNRSSLILSYLNYGEAYIKQGEFFQAEWELNKAAKLSSTMKPEKFKNSIIYNLAISRSKQFNFNYLRAFIAEHDQQLIEGNFQEVTPMVKTWFYYLNQIGDVEGIENLLGKNKPQLDKQPEFYWQMQAFVHTLRKNYEEAATCFLNSQEYINRITSEYALAINNIGIAQIFISQRKIAPSRAALENALQLCRKNKFQYWNLVARVQLVRVNLQDATINMRYLIRELKMLQEEARERNYFLQEILTYKLLIGIFSHLKKNRDALRYLKRYKTMLTSAADGLPVKEKEIFLNTYHYFAENPAEIVNDTIVSRNIHQRLDWQEDLYELIKITNNTRIFTLVKKLLIQLFAPDQVAMVLSEQLLSREEPAILYNFTDEVIYSQSYLEEIRECLDKREIIQKKINGINVIFVPLKIKSLDKGCLILTDSGELSFQKFELELLTFIRLHITSILIRRDELQQLNERSDLMHKLMNSTQELFDTMTVLQVQKKIVASAIDMFGAVRGFFITVEGLGNYSFSVAIDESNNLLSSYSMVGKEVISRVAVKQIPFFVNRHHNSELIPQMSSGGYKDLEIYTTPIMIDNELYGYLYLDNANIPERLLTVNREFTPLFLNLVSTILRNVLRYQKLIQIESKAEQLMTHKEKFIQIVSHELQQPMAIIRSFIQTMKELPQFKDISEFTESFIKTSNQLNIKINQIIEHFHYTNLEKLDLQPMDICQELVAAKHRAEEMVKNSRNIYFTLDIPTEPLIAEIDSQSFNIMLDKILGNSIRFSLDKSITKIGVRLASTLAERVNDFHSFVIYISDEGIGIKDSEIENIFNEFYEANDIYSHRSGSLEFNSAGLGLGLATARQIALLHGGKIWASSNKNGKGTTFYISLPVFNNREIELNE
ncbi:MAG: protein kinase [Candidatus Cloacimonetes bacterium]|nr:protein kinase [Candidatus Cloacimonadota bacterium]